GCSRVRGGRGPCRAVRRRRRRSEASRPWGFHPFARSGLVGARCGRGASALRLPSVAAGAPEVLPEDGEELELALEGAVVGGGADDEEDDGAVEGALGFAGLAVGGDDRGEASDGDVGVYCVEAAAGGEGAWWK